LNVPDLQASPANLGEYFTDKQILRSLVMQLNKDLASAAIPLKFLLTVKYGFVEMREKLSRELEKLSMQQVFNFLYRVDISEQELMRGMPTPGLDLDLFSELIIKRELQKVVLRKLYSDSSAQAEIEDENED
jgi:hypothetical protein